MKTRFTEQTGIEIRRLLPGHWRHVDCNDGLARPVGPAYKSQAEALADHESYLLSGGWLPRTSSCPACGSTTASQHASSEGSVP